MICCKCKVPKRGNKLYKVQGKDQVYCNTCNYFLLPKLFLPFILEVQFYIPTNLEMQNWTYLLPDLSSLVISYLPTTPIYFWNRKLKRDDLNEMKNLIVKSHQIRCCSFKPDRNYSQERLKMVLEYMVSSKKWYKPCNFTWMWKAELQEHYTTLEYFEF